MSAGAVIVELFGIPRLRAGRAELAVAPGSVADVLAEVRLRCPGLSDLLTDEGQLSPHYLLSIDGSCFLKDLAHTLRIGERLLLLSADPGG